MRQKLYQSLAHLTPSRRTKCYLRAIVKVGVTSLSAFIAGLLMIAFAPYSFVAVWQRLL